MDKTACYKILGELMRILQLHSKPPIPKADGGCMAADSLAQGLIDAGCDMYVLCASTVKHPCDLEALQAVYPEAQCAPISSRLNWGQKIQLSLGLGQPMVDRFYDDQLAEKIRESISRIEPEVVMLEGLFMGAYLPFIRASWPKQIVVLRSHNREHLIWQRLSKNANIFLRLAYSRVAKNLYRAERAIIEQVDAILPLSQVEADSWRDDGWNGALRIVPFGIRAPKKPLPTWPTGPFKMGHLGSMDWAPNREGIDWFLAMVWPDIYLQNPDATFHIAGRGMPETLGAGMSGVVNHGEVADADAFCNGLHLFVVPLLSGGGIRVKIVEAMMRGNAVLATLVASEGLDVGHGEDIFIASPAEFKSAAIDLMCNPDQVQGAVDKGRKRAVISFDQQAIGADVANYFLHLRLAHTPA